MKNAMQRWTLFLPLIIFVVLALILWRGLSLDPGSMPSALIDKPFPEFSLPELGAEQTMLNRKNIVGKARLVNIWASWCAACKLEHPLFHALSEQGVSIISINYKDKPELAKQWLADLGNPYETTVVDRQGTLGVDLGLFGVPETYVVDRHGIIRHKHVGMLTMEQWQQQVKPIYEQYASR